MKIKTDINTHLEFDKKESDYTLIVAKPGWGKSTAMESLMEVYHDLGYTILILNDVKEMWELGYAMFEPTAGYHLDSLRHDGKPIRSRKVKLYHPFTFNIPSNKKLPEINFYGFPINEIGREEFSMITESPNESETIRLFMNASATLKKGEGLYKFVHNIEDSVIGNKKDKTKIKPDPHLFNLRITQATAKGLQEVASQMLPFSRDYMLSPSDSELNLNWDKIFNDQEHYHLFGSCWLGGKQKDKKIKQWVILALLKSIIRNIDDYAKHPILIVIQEIRELLPLRPKGYKEFLSSGMRDVFSVIRNKGRGVSATFCSQLWWDLSPEVRGTITQTMLGEMADATDLEKLSKARKLKRIYMDQLANMEYKGSFLIMGKEDQDSYSPWMPSHCHAEREYNFYDLYKKHFPEKMKSYKPLKEKMRKRFNDEKAEIYKKIKAREKQEQQEQEEKEQAKEDKKEKSEKVEEKEEQIKQLKSEKKGDKMKRAYELKQEGLSNRKIADKLGTTHKTIAKYLKEYEPIKEAETKMDFEDKFVEDEKEIELEEIEEINGDEDESKPRDI